MCTEHQLLNKVAVPTQRSAHAEASISQWSPRIRPRETKVTDPGGVRVGTNDGSYSMDAFKMLQ